MTANSAEGVATRSHQTAEAWTERQQARQLDAYLAVARHIGHWSRQIQWAVNQQTFITDPPTPQPTADEIDYSSEALIALVGTEAVWSAIRDFNTSVTEYLVAVGAAVTAEGFRNPTMHETVTAAATARQTALDAGHRAMERGNAVLDRMRGELSPERR